MKSPWLNHIDAALNRLASYSLNTVDEFEVDADPSTNSTQILQDLNQHLKAIYVRSPQRDRIVRECLEAARVVAKSRHSDIGQFMYKLADMEEIEERHFIAPIFLTGLAGLGKSALGDHIVDILGAPFSLAGIPGYRNMPIYSAIKVRIDSDDKITNLFKKISQYVRGATIDDMADWIAFYLYKNGISLIVLDELQFISAGSNSHARLATILMKFCSLGVQVLVIGNFSVGHQLMKRPQQETDRLLDHPEVLVPESPESQEWTDCVTALLQGAGSLVQKECGRERARCELFKMTFGNPRFLRRILIEAIAIALKSGRSSAGWAEIEEAYRSSRFTVPRRHASELTTALVEGRQPTPKDLRCPFEIVSSSMSSLRAGCAALGQEDAARSIELASLTRKERRHLADWNLGCSNPGRSSARGKGRADKLLDGAHELERVMNDRRGSFRSR